MSNNGITAFPQPPDPRKPWYGCNVQEPVAAMPWKYLVRSPGALPPYDYYENDVAWPVVMTPEPHYIFWHAPAFPGVTSTGTILIHNLYPGGSNEYPMSIRVLFQLDFHSSAQVWQEVYFIPGVNLRESGFEFPCSYSGSGPNYFPNGFECRPAKWDA